MTVATIFLSFGSVMFSDWTNNIVAIILSVVSYSDKSFIISCLLRPKVDNVKVKTRKKSFALFPCIFSY